MTRSADGSDHLHLLGAAHAGDVRAERPGDLHGVSSCAARGAEFLFYGGVVDKQNTEAYITHNEGLASNAALGSDSYHFSTGATVPRKYRGTPSPSMRRSARSKSLVLRHAEKLQPPGHCLQTRRWHDCVIRSRPPPHPL